MRPYRDARDAETRTQPHMSKVKEAARNALGVLEQMQEQEHINEHAYNSLAVALKSVYDAQETTRAIIELEAYADLVSYDPFVINSLPPEVRWRSVQFLNIVFYVRGLRPSLCNRCADEDDDKWACHMCSIYTDDATIEDMRAFTLCFATHRRRNMPAVLSCLQDKNLLISLMRDDAFATDLVTACPRAVCWSWCDRNPNSPHRSLILLAAECADKEDWASDRFREVVFVLTSKDSYVVPDAPTRPSQPRNRSRSPGPRRVDLRMANDVQRLTI